MSRDFFHRTSLVLNAVLVPTVVVLALPRSDRAPPRPTAGRVDARRIASQAGRGRPGQHTPADPPLQYTDLSSASDRRRLIVDRLRAMGVPNQVLARVAQADFEVQWDSRLEECNGDMDKLAAVQLAMDMDKDAEMRAALGEEGFRQWDQEYMLWEAMSTKVDVTPSEAAAIYGLKKKLQARRLQLEQARLNGTMDNAAISDAYDEAYAEYHEQLKQVLGEERYAKSQQLDDAFAADILRHQLAPAHPTDAQFEELFKAERKWNRARAELGRQYQEDPSAPEYLKQLRALDEMHDQEYRRVLGADVFYELRKEQDPAYARMRKYEKLWGLDEQEIDYVYGAMKDYEKSVEAYKTQVLALEAGGRSVDWGSVDRDLRRFGDQIQQELREYLGQESFDQLQRNRVLRFMTIRRRAHP